MRTLPELFLHNTAAYAARPALVTADRAFTYADLRADVLALAADLARRGVRPGDRVGVMLRNSPEFVVAYWAVLGAGGVAVPLNDEYRHNEILYFIDACGLSLILTNESHRDVCDAVLPQATTRCALSFSETWQALPPADAWRPPAVDPAAPAMFQSSSGSTGRPKRIARSHAKLLWELDALADAFALTPDDRFLGVAPFSHVNGLMRSMMASFRAGASLYPVAHFDRQVVATLIERERLTIFIGVPFMFIVLAETRFDPAPNWRSLRWCISASAPLPIKYNRAFRDRFGIHVRQLYGSTETGSMSVNLSDDIAETLDSVGAPLPGITFGIVDDGGRRVPADTVAEVTVSSPGAIDGYDGFPELNAEVFRDGFFHTGDLGRLDARGRLYLQGRLKFLINKSGFKIDPREVESVLEDHPGVDQVAVVGVVTPYGDEKVKAVIVRRGPCTEFELAEFCRGKIADFKIPSVFEFRDAMPTSPTGKIRRGLLTS